MSEIPDDVMKAAREARAQGAFDRILTTEVIARAILAERQRCAEVAKRMLVYADTTSRADAEIYRAIMGEA